jgi:hypothetical protein
MTDRPKFLRYCGLLQLRVEQIGPALWVGSRYAGCLLVPAPDGSERLHHLWEVFTALSEDAAKHGALAMADRFGPAPASADAEWRNLSDISDEDWAKTIGAIGFPGYPEREGMERWSGF